MERLLKRPVSCNLEDALDLRAGDWDVIAVIGPKKALESEAVRAALPEGIPYIPRLSQVLSVQWGSGS